MNRDEPAFPKLIQEGHSGEYVYAFDGGMTKREYAAVEIYAALRANPHAWEEMHVYEMRTKAIQEAEDLFDELDKEGAK
jgi:hypothetical protein